MGSGNRSIRTALITGASEGIGMELARIMAADGWSLVLVARREELLTTLAEELTSRYGVECFPIRADLTDREAIPSILKSLFDRKIVIDALVNNAGVGYYGLFAGQDGLRLRQMLDLNVSALIDLALALLPSMIDRRSGHILNVASTASFQPVPTNALYGATKALVLSFSEAIATELRGTGVLVTCLCPGVTRTGFARSAGAVHLDLQNDFRGSMSAGDVARLGYRAMLRGRRVVVTGGVNRLLAFCTRLVPRSLAADIAFRLMKNRRR